MLQNALQKTMHGHNIRHVSPGIGNVGLIGGQRQGTIFPTWLERVLFTGQVLPDHLHRPLRFFVFSLDTEASVVTIEPRFEDNCC